MLQGPRQSRKKFVTFLGGVGGGAPEERPYEVSRGQNRYMTLNVNLGYTIDSVMRRIGNGGLGRKYVENEKNIVTWS